MTNEARSGIGSATVRLLRLSWQQDRVKTATAVGLVVAGSASAPLTAFALRWLTNEAVARHATGAALAGLAVAALAICTLVLGHFAHIAYFELSELNVLRMDQELMELSNGSAGLEHHERADIADDITVLREEVDRFRNALEAVLLAAGLGVAVVITGVLLATMNPLLLLLPVVAVPPLLTGRIAERLVDRAKTASAGPTRKARGLFRMATTATTAQELRLFRLQREVMDRHASLWAEATTGLWRAQRNAAAVRAAGQLVFATGYVAAVLAIVSEAVRGRRTVGDVILVITLAAQVNQQVASAVSLLEAFQRMASTYHRLDRLRALVTRDQPTGDGTPARIGTRLATGIDLIGLGFTYPGTQRPVLSGVDLRIPAGTTVAVVGENGAGKSTLVKLLCGFYRPTEGRIEIDGTDLDSLPIEAWRDRTTAGFQDFVRFEFAAQRVVGLGDLPRLDDESAVLTALERANATDVLDRLPAGLRTHLGKSYAAGHELSGGQWQKLALGRALIRDEPLMLVLDEPTSALDATAEHALFERYAEQARQAAARNGAVTVLVSHRFSTVRMADLIVVVAGGGIAEFGDHTELMANGGLYAELYRIQAEAYGVRNGGHEH